MNLVNDISKPQDQPRTRTINVEVPEAVYWLVRKCAIESRLSMKDDMEKCCEEAWAIAPEPPPIA